VVRMVVGHTVPVEVVRRLKMFDLNNF
jgi:hypothetical protein